MEHFIALVRAILTKRFALRLPRFHDPHHFVHWAHTHMHTVYFGAVWHEAHGLYGQAAGVLFVLSVVSLVVEESA